MQPLMDLVTYIYGLIPSLSFKVYRGMNIMQAANLLTKKAFMLVHHMKPIAIVPIPQTILFIGYMFLFQSKVNSSDGLVRIILIL